MPAKRLGRTAWEFSRRDLLRSGVVSLGGIGLAGMRQDFAGTTSEPRCILLTLVGGPSHVDTWDMKPDAPSSHRGPFRPIATRVPGIAVSEIFPQLARIMDRVSLVRSCHHDAAPVHPESLERMIPKFGDLSGPATILGTIADVGGGHAARSKNSSDSELMSHARSAVPAAYGSTRFGRDCWRAARLIESGTRFVHVNMSQTVFDQPSWDAHGKGPFCGLDAYRSHMGPAFDAAFSGLILDLERSGLLAHTMVVAMGEFGRTPRLNESGGRDHHPGCFTTLWAGGPIRGGQVVGASDAEGDFPRDRPVSPDEIHATIALGLGVPASSPIAELL